MDQFNRTSLLFGEEKIQKFQESRVAIMGLGGVGSYAAEALARSGIGEFLLVDFDTISITNINRQLPALHDTIGRLKTEAMRERLLKINPNLKIDIYSDFCAEDSRNHLLKNLDFVVDAIDSLTPKVGLLEECYHKKIPVISGYDMDATQYVILYDYRQDDEEWWQSAKENGFCKVYTKRTLSVLQKI
jgi:tRNA A37 threonylcarbamoyladenosine dehydratase